MAIELSDDIVKQYHALGEGCGYHWFPQRTILEITGADRVKFLHNFCTADIKKLEWSGSTEAFITNVQGKTVGYVYVSIGEENIVLEGAAGQAEVLLPHLSKYIVLEDAELVDRSGVWSSLLVAGDRFAGTCLTAPGIASDVLKEKSVAMLPGFVREKSAILVGESPQIESSIEQVKANGAIECGPEAVEMRRLEAGMPQFGTEVTDDNLPQEVGRDEQAISFTKGCYLGQETVARIDALGHVNRYLRLVKFSSETLPDRGWEHKIDEKQVLKVTSTAWSPKLSAPIALAYIRRGHEAIGNRFETAMGPVEVIEPPGA